MAADGTFKNTLLGGFNKRDVAEYIENAAKRTSEYKAEKERLEQRCITLEEELEESKAELEKLRSDNREKTMKLETIEDELAQKENMLTRLESVSDELVVRLKEAEEKAAIYDTAKERIAVLELNASKRAVEIEKAAELRAAEMIKRSERYLGTIKTEYTKVCDDTRQNASYIVGELNAMTDRLNNLSTLLSEKADVFDNIEAVAEKKAAPKKAAKHVEPTEQTEPEA